MARRPVNWKRWVRESRRLLGLSAPALADLLGVSLRTIRYWEAGEVVPDQGKVSLLCQFVKLAEKRGAT